MKNEIVPLTGGNICSSEVSLAITRPVSYPQLTTCFNPEEYLSALYDVSNQAFRAIPAGSWAISVVEPLLTGEKLTAPKKGGKYDPEKLRTLRSKVSDHSSQDNRINLVTPLVDEEKTFFERTSYGYDVFLRFQPSEEHILSVKKMAAFIMDLALQSGKKIHEQDQDRFASAEYKDLNVQVGVIHDDFMDDYTRAEISDAVQYGRPAEILADNYSRMPAHNRNAVKILERIEREEFSLCFDALQLVGKRKTRRNK